MNPKLALRLHELSLGGEPGGQAVKGKTGKGAQLIAAGWRFVPIPYFWAACRLWNDGKGQGNPAMIDFAHPREWLVIPPDDVDLPATKIVGKVCAIRWAYRHAEGGQVA